MFKLFRYEDAVDDKTGAGGGGGAAGAGDKSAAGAGDGATAGDKGAAEGKGAATAQAGDKGHASGDAGQDSGDKSAGEGDKAPTWPEDWRQRYSGEDVKKMERLSRYASPAAAFDALLSLQSKIGAGELRSNLPKNATAEQIAAWRADNGIPEAPDKYTLVLPEGMKVQKEDKPLIDGFLSRLHGANANSQVASEAIAWYYEEAARRTEERLQKDTEIAKTNEDALRAEWGNEYRTNINMVNGLVETMPADARALFQTGRLGDGSPIMSNPGVLKALVAWSRQINPITTIVPNSGANIGSAIEDEITSIEKRMATDRKGYNADEKQQTRLRELYDARERIGQKK